MESIKRSYAGRLGMCSRQLAHNGGRLLRSVTRFALDLRPVGSIPIEAKSISEMLREAWAWSWLMAGIGFGLGLLFGTAIFASILLGAQ
jgi:hypothetical protein